MPEAMRMKGNSSILLFQRKKTQKSSDVNYQMKDMKEFKQIVVQHHCHRCTSQSLGSLKMTNGIDANTRKAQRKHMIEFMSVHLLENSNSGEAVPVQPLEMSDHASISVRGKRPWELLHQHLLTSQSNCNVYIAIKEQNQHVPVDKLDLADSDVWWTSAHPSTPDRGTWNSHNSSIQSAKKGYKRSDGFLCPTMSKWQQTWGGKCTGNGWCIWFIWIRCANVAPKPLAN